MFGNFSKFAAAAVSLAMWSACGGDLEVYNNRVDTGAESDQSAATPDSGSDSGTTPTPNNVSVPEDMGSSVEPDLPTTAPDMGTPDPRPTMNVPQQGPTIGSQVTSSCSTISVKGISIQLIDMMNCLDPGVMKSFDGAPGLSYGATVFPYQQGPATDALTAVAANNAGTMPISSALRSVPQQYLLYEWYTRGLCNANLAASPGRSNHNGGLAVDIGDSGIWRTPMRNASYIDNVSGEPWHFYFSGAGGKDVRSLSVLAFQKLYNYNFPETPITEDGAYGPMTEGAMVGSPANGFTEVPVCQASLSFQAYPHSIPLDVEWEHLGDNFVGIRTLAPAGVQLIEYFVDGHLVGFADHDERWFETVFELPRGGAEFAAIEVVAYDRDGGVRGSATGLLDVADRHPLFVRPLGGGNYELGLERVPNTVRGVDFFVDGLLVEQERHLAISQDKMRLTAQLRGDEEIDVVLLDGRDEVVEMRNLRFAP